MKFRIEKQEKNIKVTLLEEVSDKAILEDVNSKSKVLTEEEIELAKATCFFENTPRVNGKNIGCIGEFESKNFESGVKVLKKCEEILKEKNVELIVAPMNGNTWKKYRTLKYSNGDNLFTLENVNPESDNKILQEAGFKQIYTYTSTKGLIQDAYQAESLKIIEDSLKEENVTIRKFNKQNYLEDLKKIYNVSKVSFARNPFYTRN